MTAEYIRIRKTYKYRLYHCTKRNKHLHQRIDIAGLIWNHCLALQKRYYRLFRKYIPQKDMKPHVSWLRMHTQKFRHWKLLGSQSVQAVQERLDAAYQRFFNKEAKRPKFKKVKKYSSFVVKQAWELRPDLKPPVLKSNGRDYERGIGCVVIDRRRYKFIKHRPMNGDVKTVTIKRDQCGDLWVCFSVIETVELKARAMTGQSAGADFGLKTFLTTSDGHTWMHPLFFAAELHRIRQLNKALSHKQPGSGNHRRAQQAFAHAHRRIADKRRDYHYKLAHALCRRYDHIFIEDLNLRGMKRLWGRKVGDLGFGKFVPILERVGLLERVTVLKIGRFNRTSTICSHCGQHQPMPLHVRTFACQNAACGQVMDRDWNAAINIHNIGSSMLGLRGR